MFKKASAAVIKKKPKANAVKVSVAAIKKKPKANVAKVSAATKPLSNA